MTDGSGFWFIVFLLFGVLAWNYYHPDMDDLIERTEKVCIAHLKDWKEELKETEKIACSCHAEHLSYILSEDQYKKYVDTLWDTVVLDGISEDSFSFSYRPKKFDAYLYSRPNEFLKYGTTNDQKERLRDVPCWIVGPLSLHWTFFLPDSEYVKQAQKRPRKLEIVE